LTSEALERLLRGAIRRRQAADALLAISERMAEAVKGFGCRPGASDRPGIGAGVRKPPKKEPAGKRRAVGRLWGFGVAAALAGDGFPKIAES
jgi:hypothetical protein